MADSTHLNMDLASRTEDTPPSVQSVTRISTGYLSKPYADYSSYQKLQIELYRFKFLKNCRACKRPPTSLRICGASAIKNETRLRLFSYWETQLLEEAIKEKQKLLKKLEKSSMQEDKISLSDIDKYNTENHFHQKLSFFLEHNKSKWKNWPKKNRKEDKKQKNFNKKQKRRSKKTETQAKKAVDSGSVV